MKDQWLFTDRELLEPPSLKDNIINSHESYLRIKGIDWLTRIGVTAGWLVLSILFLSK